MLYICNVICLGAVDCLFGIIFREADSENVDGF